MNNFTVLDTTGFESNIICRITFDLMHHDTTLEESALFKKNILH